MIKATHQVFSKTITDNVIPSAMANALDKDVFLFSGLKTHAQLFEASRMLRDEEGKIKSFNEFAKDFNKVNQKYNQAYLAAEHQYAVHAAQSAAKWAEFSDDTERYYLQYRTAKDDKVRDEHAALADVTLPKDNPFWDTNMPPLGWNCRCLAVEVRAAKYEKSNSEDAIQKGEKATTQIGKDGSNKLAIFRYNPGKQKVIFPPKHPYKPQHCNGGKLNMSGMIGYSTFILSAENERCRAKKVIEEMLGKHTVEQKQKIYAKPLKEQYKEAYTNKGTTAKVELHELVNKKQEDYKDVLYAAKAWTKLKVSVKIQPIIHASEKEARRKIFHGLKSKTSNPDLLVKGKYIDVKNPKKWANINGLAIQASKQSAEAMIVDKNIQFTEEKAKNQARRIFMDKNYTQDKVHFVIKGKIHTYNRTGDK